MTKKTPNEVKLEMKHLKFRLKNLIVTSEQQSTRYVRENSRH